MFTGLGVRAVLPSPYSDDKISISFGNRNNPVAGGSGMVFFDDIRLYAPELETP